MAETSERSTSGTGARSTPLLFDHYQVEKVLGNGAMGVVYLARDMRIGRLAALKTLRPPEERTVDPEEAQEFIRRFRREAELCGSLVHSNIVTLYEVGYAQDQIRYLAMEYVEGQSLFSLLQRYQRLEIEAAFKVTDDILQGLSYAHDAGIVHRDIKPANVLVTRYGHAKIADFGVARSARAHISNLTRAGHLLGTPYYMSPEQVAGREIDARSDLFSVGVVIYELLSGARPFEAESVMDILYDIVNREPKPLTAVAPGIPRWCETFTAKLLSKNPSQRFLSASVASQELRRLLTVHHQMSDSAVGRPEPVSILRELPADELQATPVSTPSRRRFRIDPNRYVSTGVATAVLGSVLAVAIALGAAIAVRIDDRPTVTIPPPQIHEFEQRRELLREAELLYEAGAYEASLRRYETYLDRWGDQPSALEGRRRAQFGVMMRGESDTARPSPAAQGPD